MNESAAKPELPDPAAVIDAWDVQRYVLGDVELDRAAFEARMLVDARLALAVAACVDELSRIATACDLQTRPAGDAAPVLSPAHLLFSRLATARWVLAGVLAASLLLAFSVWQRPSAPPLTQANPSVSEPQLSQVAAGWLALEASVDLPPDELLGDGHADHALPSLSNGEIFEASNQALGSEIDEGDWMLEAAAAYFREAAEI